MWDHGRWTAVHDKASTVRKEQKIARAYVLSSTQAGDPSITMDQNWTYINLPYAIYK
jgi:hypothetical protein